MNITIFGATGSVGSECVKQALAAGHRVRVLVRDPAKLPAALRQQVLVVEGNALERAHVEQALPADTEAILFAIGVDGASPANLCADVTRHILARMPATAVKRFVWCGGGSTFVADDQITLGARFVRWVAETFMSKRHFDKEQQWALLQQHSALPWVGVRPLQMRKGPCRGTYRMGFDTFSGLSWISFADCAHAMVKLLEDDRWLRKAPIVQY